MGPRSFDGENDSFQTTQEFLITCKNFRKHIIANDNIEANNDLALAS